MEEILKRQQRRLREAADDFAAASEAVWEMVIAFQNYPFFTVKNCEFRYTVKGYEIKISRKEKTITRATVDVALKRALELSEVSGPKKLGVFGASYLYPMFLYFGIITKKK